MAAFDFGGILGSISGSLQTVGAEFLDAINDLSGTSKKKAPKVDDKDKDGFSLDFNFGQTVDTGSADIVQPIVQSDLLKLILSDKELDVSRFISGV